MTKVFAELNDKQDRIALHFGFDAEVNAAIKRISGYRFHPADKSFSGRAHWSVPLSLDAARRLREEFGPELQLGIGVRAWGKDAVRTERELNSLSTADDAVLENVRPDVWCERCDGSGDEQIHSHPNGPGKECRDCGGSARTAGANWLRPYQRADVAMMARADVINANQPGVGKTVEVIYAVEEAGLFGPHLVVCPTSLFKDPWRDELAAHAPDATVLWGETPEERREAIREASRLQDRGEAGNVWLLLNPEIVRPKRFDSSEPIPPHSDGSARTILSKSFKGTDAYCPADETAELLFDLRFGAIVADEFHKYGLGADRETLFSRGLGSLRKNAQRAFALSGTPTGGKPVRLFGPLNFTRPDLFTSKWKWAGLWLTNAEGTGPVDPGAGTGIGGVQPGREEEFYNAHAQYMVRRTRAEALPGLPPKVIQDVWCDMTAKQAKQYRELERATEVAAEGGSISTNGVLSEYTRLKQIANAMSKLDGGEVLPVLKESGKMSVLIDRLDTYGVRKDDAEPGARAIVASESQRLIAALEPHLKGLGLNVKRLDGTVTGRDRDAVIDWYKDVDGLAGRREARVLVMTTQTGGVGLNLGMTGSIHVLDETWNPDDQEQLEDRGMRNRTTPLQVLYYRTRDTVQEYIYEIGLMKTKQNKKVLADALRQRVRDNSRRNAA